MGHVLHLLLPQFILSLGLQWVFLYRCLTCRVCRNYIFIQMALQIFNPIEQEMDITSDTDVRYSDEDLSAFSHEELICHLESLEWEQARLRGEVGRTCPPFWDRYRYNISFFVSLFVFVSVNPFPCRISCWPPVPEGAMATIPCFSHLRGVAYDTSSRCIWVILTE